MRPAADSAPLITLVATALLGGQQVAAGLPPKDAKCYYKAPTLLSVPGGQIYDCKVTDYYCPEHAETFMSEPFLVAGYVHGPATVGAGSSHTETAGWIAGGSLTATL